MNHRASAARLRTVPIIATIICQGGVAAARQLLHGPPSDGFTALWERGRLDLTVEALILAPAFTDRFTDDERTIARNRLEQYGYGPR
jgi:hypothetical protein